MRCETCLGVGRVACFAGSMRCPACDGRGRRPLTAEEWAEATAAFEAAAGKLAARLAEIGWAMAEALGPVFERMEAAMGKGRSR